MSFKKISVFVLFISLFMVFVACDNTTTTYTTIDTTIQSYDYGYFANQFISDPNLQLSASDQPYYIYYYGESCTHCIAIKQEVLSIVLSLQNDQVFFVSTNSYLDVMSGINVRSTPSLVYVVNHQVQQIYVGDTDVLEIFHTMS